MFLNFEILDKRVFNNPNLNPHRYVNYKLPRQCGSTTYLVNKYNELKRQGYRVLYITHNMRMATELVRSPRTDYKTGIEYSGTLQKEDATSMGSVINKLRGSPRMAYDYILIDNGMYSVEDNEEIINTLLTFYCKGTILGIDTVE